jgi:hypothetical protein
MRIKHVALLGALAGLLGATFRPGLAGVPSSEAQRLASELTPLGAERSGGADGQIPPWEGGYTEASPGYRSGQPRPDPFAAEKPILRIDAKNMAQHADKLSDGVRALLERFPTFRVDVYPTHRTAAAPRFVYDDTLQNATRATTKQGGVSITGAHRGIPFPIPRNGAEAIWNHLLAWKGESVSYKYRSYIVVGSDSPVLTTGAELHLQFPYYDPAGSADRFEGNFLLTKTRITEPPFKVGESLLTHDPVDQFEEGRKAWQYIVGQRRVRRAPTVSYDNPSSLTSGFSLFDEIFLFNGAIDRYDWKLVGKRDLIVPYNTARFHTKKISEVLGPHHLNPDHVRWELHRVWVVEATLASGKRHVMPKRRFYLDEDTWLAVLSDGWDARGQLWHVGLALPFVVPELPGVVTGPYVIFDLVKDGYAASSLMNESERHYQVLDRRPDSYFSPGALAAEGVR